jgi:hypothetical protein
MIASLKAVSMEADMKQALLLLSLTLAAGCTAEGAVAPSESGGARLAAALEGRTPGAPMNCVSQLNLRSSRSAGEEAIIFDGPGGTIYVNRPPAGCPSLEGRAMVTRSTSSQLCRGDIVTVIDTATGTEYGSCGLGEFVPYRRGS